MRIAIVGTGYQGLVVGTCLAESGHQVVCVEQDAERAASLQRGEVPFHEPGLEELLSRNIEEEHISFTTDLVQAVRDCLCILFCVNPPVSETGEVDTAVVLELASQVAACMPGYRLFINKGACPPGTAAALDAIFRTHTKQPFDIIVNPDFLKAGKAIDDFMQPDRVIVGCEDVRVQELIREIYSPFLRTGRPILFMSKASAEMAKYATTVMLASRISMMNQLAEISTAVGADISQVREAVASDGRIGSTFLFPGLGYGGVHLPGDVDACIHFAETHGVNAELIKAVKGVNLRCQEHFERQILDYYGDAIGTKTIAVWGATFKPRTDDIRGSIAIRIIDRLLERGATVRAHDPVAGPALEARYQGRITVAAKAYDALQGADGLVIATEWSNYRRPTFGRMAELMAERVIFDGRNLFQPEDMAEHGFTYFSVGR